MWIAGETPTRHSREGGSPACFEQYVQEKLNSRLRGNDGRGSAGMNFGDGVFNCGDCCDEGTSSALRAPSPEEKGMWLAPPHNFKL
jgi:hypothetical protein